MPVYKLLVLDLEGAVSSIKVFTVTNVEHAGVRARVSTDIGRHVELWSGSRQFEPDEPSRAPG